MKNITNPSLLEPESVWDYPRPPRVERSQLRLQVLFNGVLIAETRNAFRVLETSHPPVYYFPPQDVQMKYLSPSPRSSFCEWKGRALYYNIQVDNKVVQNAAWYYPKPSPSFSVIENHIAFYPQLMDACYVEGERVKPQPGNFYGGWITSNLIGPFKGETGSENW